MTLLRFDMSLCSHVYEFQPVIMEEDKGIRELLLKEYLFFSHPLDCGNLIVFVFSV